MLEHPFPLLLFAAVLPQASVTSLSYLLGVRLQACATTTGLFPGSDGLGAPGAPVVPTVAHFALTLGPKYYLSSLVCKVVPESLS